ncbi:hypothetical protein RYX36_023622 [Vicia faba]
MQRFHLGLSQNPTLMMDSSSSPLSLQTPLTESSPKHTKKTLLSSLIGTNTPSSLRTPSFEEDKYFINLLKSSEKKSLQDLKKHLLESTTSNGTEAGVSMWGVPLLGGDDRADVILLKFLRARDFRVNEPLTWLPRLLQPPNRRYIPSSTLLPPSTVTIQPIPSPLLSTLFLHNLILSSFSFS